MNHSGQEKVREQNGAGTHPYTVQAIDGPGKSHG
jgi:hypothetical protein